MNREEYMKILSVSLKDIPAMERDEAIKYYNDYFDDAGIENEQDVIKNLGSPATLAESIKNGAMDGNVEGNHARQNFQGQRTYQVPFEVTDQAKNQKKSKLSGGMIALIVVLCILASPLLLAIAAVGISLVIGLLAVIFGAVVAVIAVLVSLLLAGIAVGVACIIAAVVLAVSSPFGAVFLIGVFIASIGVCIFVIMATVWFFGVAIPWIVKGIGKLFKKIFRKKGGRN